MKYNLADIMDIIGGGTPKTNVEEYWDGEIPWLSVKDFNNDNRYVYRAEKTITKLGLENSSTKLLRYDDIIISAWGTVGEVAMIPYPMAFNQSCYGLRAKDEIVDSTYLYYLIRYNIRELRRKSHGSVFDTITKDTFTNIEIDLPNMTIQRKVAIILKEIDDKIECNHAINKNLEEQARAIFDAWFISFDVFNGNIPKSWKTLRLSDVAKLSAGGDKPVNVSVNKSEQCPYPIYSNGTSLDGLYGYTEKPLINEESVTVSARGTIGFVCLRHIPYVPIVRLITVIPKKECISAKYLYFWLKNLSISGTGTTQQQLTVPFFKNTEILVPPIEIITDFTDTVSPLFSIIYHNENEVERLTAIRDALLPRLMSGELDVSNIAL